MKISAGIAVWLCAVFALVCLGFVVSGLQGLDAVTEEAEREASLGYIWYWLFLSAVATVFGVLSWMISKGKLGDPE